MVKEQTDRDAFAALMGNADNWATISDIVETCDSAGFWSDEFIRAATLQAKKSQVRRLIKQQRDESDWPIWASVESTDADGNRVRVYKQESLFDIDDYRQVAVYHADRSAHHRAMASGYAKRCRRRFGKQLSLHFAKAEGTTP